VECAENSILPSCVFARGRGSEAFHTEVGFPSKRFEIDGEEERAQREQELREDIDIHRMASEVVVDEIVSPSSLREELTNRFAFYETVEKDLPNNKHGTIL
jgi:acetyl-CoA carboxylase carboxyltransferase component